MCFFFHIKYFIYVYVCIYIKYFIYVSIYHYFSFFFFMYLIYFLYAHLLFYIFYIFYIFLYICTLYLYAHCSVQLSYISNKIPKALHAQFRCHLEKQ